MIQFSSYIYNFFIEIYMYYVLGILYIPLICHGFFSNRFINTVRTPSLRSPSLEMMNNNNNRNYPFSRYYYEKYLKRLNSKNATSQSDAIMEGNNFYRQAGYGRRTDYNPQNIDEENSKNGTQPRGIRIILGANGMGLFTDDNDNEGDDFESFKRGGPRSNKKKSKHFEIVSDIPYSFKDVGGYDNIKLELDQCIDILTNYTKYANFNVRVPKGLIFEGPPGNGKTLLAKALAGESKSNFISVSGAEFQEKYVGVGASRVRELFDFAIENRPCIIFIDEIDAIGRTRSGDGETSSSERDNTLNELLVNLDGFKNATGIFLIGATNRADLLDPALMRPGRVDKRIYINNPDETTRKAIFDIHIKGKPCDNTISIDNLVENSNGLSGAQIENLLNEAMLLAIRNDRGYFNSTDIDVILNRMLVGYQPNAHDFTQNIIDHIAIHELGHGVVGHLVKHHAKMKKIIINLSAPSSPGYTLFEPSQSGLNTREALFEHLMILLAGRIAEEVIYGVSVTTGAINDFEEALKLAQKMIVYYGMGKKIIYPYMSDAYKEKIDDEVIDLINQAYECAEFIVRNCKDLVIEGADLLKETQLITAQDLDDIINDRYSNIKQLKI